MSLLATKSRNFDKKIKRLFDLIENRLRSEKEETKLKKELKEFMTNNGVKIIFCGELAAIISDKERRDLNREQLEKELGKDYQKYLTLVQYQTFEVRKRA